MPLILGSIVVAGNDSSNYSFEWNKGVQPWCNSREREVQKENLYKWFKYIIVPGIIMIIVSLFLCCWCIKRKRGRRNSMSTHRINDYIAGQKVVA
jgi:hypothetical protein